jgi:hypothetical protein
MKITAIVNRFEFYATQNLALAYDPEAKDKSFFVCDLEALQSALKTGIRFPAMFAQVPEFEKDGNTDSPMEHIEGSFMILKSVKVNDVAGRLQAYDDCKEIADQVLNYMIEDSGDFFDGGFLKTSEGHFGPVADSIYGWAVNYSFEQGYDGVRDPAKWRPE